MRLTRRRLAFALGAAAVLAVAGVLALALQRGGESTVLVAEHPIEVPAQVRSVFVSLTMPTPSAGARRLSAKLESGTLPSGATTGEVLTDTDCTPDHEMISRCRNEVRLRDGSRIVLRHPHDMTTVPCLAPGERVRLVPAAL
jgi:hypothetical protein